MLGPVHAFHHLHQWLAWLHKKWLFDICKWLNSCVCHRILIEPLGRLKAWGVELAIKAARWAKTWPGMLFSAEKSGVLTIGKRKDHPETGMNMERISMDSVLVPVCQKHKHLGVQINNRLSWLDHVDELHCDGMCSQNRHAVCSLHKRVSNKCLAKIYIGHLSPLGIRMRCLEWREYIEVMSSSSSERFCWRHQARLPSLEKRFKYLMLLMFFNIKNGFCPIPLSELLPDTLATEVKSMWTVRCVIYPVPRVNKSSSLCSFFPRAIIFWNSLPAGIQSSPSACTQLNLSYCESSNIWSSSESTFAIFSFMLIMFINLFFPTPLVSWIRHFPFLFLHLFSLLSGIFLIISFVIFLLLLWTTGYCSSLVFFLAGA